MAETLLSQSNVLLFGREVEDLAIAPATTNREHSPFVVDRKGGNKLLQSQLAGQEGARSRKADTARFARIYGFSYEGTYYDLPRPALFLVHGAGEPAETAPGAARVARSPDDPSRTGVAAPDFSFADGLMVWSYDKADYTIRMDVETGMFEQVLLDIFFDGGGGGGVSGHRVSGHRVSGHRVSGHRVSGHRVSGHRVGGPRGDASD